MKYNGWANYETWVVKLWIDNDEVMLKSWQDRLKEIVSYLKTPEGYSDSDKKLFTLKDRFIHEMEKDLREDFKDSAPDLGASVWADLLNSAIQEVNFYEIAEDMVTNYLAEASHV